MPIMQTCSLRAHIVVHGVVQGVGFRPFVYRLATELHLSGWVQNTIQGVVIEIEGATQDVDAFLFRFSNEIPPLASIHEVTATHLEPVGYTSFEIRESDSKGKTSTLILPDIATCPDCLEEVFNPSERRYFYPFTNCTNCGPRFSIIESLPYDRPNTTMKQFVMCVDCRKEYENPHDRRFHAQPIACPVCGPHIELWDLSGNVLDTRHNALLHTVETIRSGKIVAVKGMGGFHLLADARNESAVHTLRQRKGREEKPLALMFPSIEKVQSECEVSILEETLLQSPESPIVLLKRKSNQSQIAVSVAPSNPYLGVMLPYTPLHHILMRELNIPVVATSGNRSNEPICIDEHEALKRLNGIADYFLIHNRPIKRHVDDSIVRVMAGREMIVRRARGYAPLPPTRIKLRGGGILAVGAHQKNTISITTENNVFTSQHIGDLETTEAFDAFSSVINDFRDLYDVNPTTVVCDFHPDYLSTKYAEKLGIKTEYIQHHYAHVASCMAENDLSGTVLGVSWDGTGYGLDNTIWGGEFLLTTETSFKRVATFRSFPLPGGDQAVKQPRRSAVGVLFELFGEDMFRRNGLLTLQQFSIEELKIIQTMLVREINTRHTSSVGRLFDAVASIMGIRHTCNFEGQSAMELEFLVSEDMTQSSYPFTISESRNNDVPYIINWERCIVHFMDDVNKRESPNMISTKFHNTLTEVIIEVAKRIGEQRIVLSGGCFQNIYLTEHTIARLREEGYEPYWHKLVPTNDGGISLGQVYAYMRSQHSNITQQSTEGEKS